jgi:hypothetical protein
MPTNKHEQGNKTQAAIRLMSELEKGRISGERDGWYALEEVRKEIAEKTSKWEKAVDLAQEDYSTDSELTAFTALDGDDFIE